MAARLLPQATWARWDGLLVALAFVHGGLLLAWPSIPLIALGLWWNANTVSHRFIHRPFFTTNWLNSAFSCYLSVVLGFPQSLWRARHLSHHGGRHLDEKRPATLDFAFCGGLWTAMAIFAPIHTLTVYLPGFLIGLGLCYLQGHYEHARGTVSHYGWLYNLLFFNDGYHIEHHERPGTHWRELSHERACGSQPSRWPAVLRWLECVNLCALERLVLNWPGLQRFVIERHERALRRLLTRVPPSRNIGIVGGGLFPRTALILRRLVPESNLALIDLSQENLAVARRFVSAGVAFVNERFDPMSRCDVDLLIIPLAFEGDREAIYRRPPAPAVLVHDWIWRRRGTGAVVSWLLLKRLNLVIR
jgi:hypothetical protein